MPVGRASRDVHRHSAPIHSRQSRAAGAECVRTAWTLALDLVLHVHETKIRQGASGKLVML